MRLVFLELVDGSSFGLLKLSQSSFLGFVGLGKDLHLIAHLFVETSHLILELLDGALVLSFLLGPILMVLLDDVVVLLLDLSHILSVVLLVVILIIHAVLLDVFYGLFQIFYFLKVFLLVFLFCVLEIVVFVLQ